MSKQQIEAVLEEKASRSLAERKLDSQLVYGLRQRRSGQAGLPVWTLRPKLRFQPDQRILVDMRARVNPGLLRALVEGGGTVVVSFKDHEAIRAIVPLPLVQTLSVREDVLGIRPADEATTNSGSIASVGDITHRADEARNLYQVDGTGVKVGVLADGAASVPLSQTNGNLPGLTILPGQAGGGDEGTAMLEIVHDLAPGAELYFATAFSGVASFAENIRALHAAGCRIIIDDVLYFNESPFQDGTIAQAVNDVSAAGTLFFSSAGNSGNKNDNTSGTWEGDFLDGGPATLGRGGRLHDFGGVTFNTVLAGGELQRVDLFWSDPLGRSSNDYDAFVLNADGSVASASANVQDGNDDPYEIIPSVDVGQRIVIVKVAGEDRFLHLSSGRGRLELSTPGATHGHNASGATNAFCVAATRVGTPVVPFTGGDANPVETFSSDGPRHMFYNPDGSPITPGNVSSTGGAVLQKPDLTAADGVATSVFAYSIFYGTSAAAPHAGAIAALLWSYNPLLTPAQVRTLLQESALDIEAPGVDRDSGAGIVMAVPAIEAAPAPAPRLFYDSNLLVDANGTGTMDVRECAELYVTLNNRIVTSGESATGVRGAISTTTPEVVVDPTPQPFADIASAGGATNLIPFRLSTTPGFLCGTPIDLRLAVTTSNAGSYTFAFQLPPSSPGIGASTSFESPDVPRVVPDLSTVASTVTVSGVSLPLARITVSLHARHPYDSDLALLLVGPDGTEVALSSNRGGSGADYGSGCDQRTVFDDAASTPITSGTWPFLGAFRPEQPLLAFQGKSGDAVNGVWTLRIRDDAPADSGTLLCWSLQVFPITCLDGGGQCLVPPRFTVEPQDVTVTNVGGAVFAAQVEGSAPLSYQWFFNRTTAVPGATNSTLAFENVTPDMAGIYAVVVSNLFGTAISREAQLGVLSAPRIVGQPQDLLVTNGHSAAFTVTASGDEPLSYQWYFNLTNSLAGETNAELVLTNASPDNAGLYSVIVTNPYGAAESVAAQLTVVVPPFITQQPEPQSVFAGSDATFTVVADGSAPLAYQWFHQTNALAGATNSTLSLVNVTINNAGGYVVEVSNPFGSIGSAPVQLTVLSAPLIVGQPQDLLVTNGHSAAFTVAANGTEPLSYQWYFNLTNSLAGETNAALVLTNATPNNTGLYSVTVSNPYGAIESVAALLTVVVPPFITQQPEPASVFAGSDASFTVVADGNAPLAYQWFHQTNALAGATNSTLSLINVTLTDAGGYVVVVSNPFGSITSAPVQLTVLSAPLIVGQPQDLLLTNGQSAVFTVTASGTEPLSYQWYFNLTNSLAGETNTALVLTNASPTNAGLYSVIVTNPYGATESVAALLTVVVPPFITQQPEPQSVFAGSDATFTIVADGNAPLAYQWFHQTNALAGATNSTLSLINVTLNDAGGYVVVVGNPFGSLTSAPVQLTVLSAPLIVGQPQDLLVTNGHSAAFTVAANGTEPLSYQWYFNLTNSLAGETNTALVLSNASPTNAGLYSVIVTNPYGATESVAALLTVVVPPFITQQPEPQSVFAGSDATFTVVADGNAPLAYQWFHQTNALAGATNSTLSLVNVTLNDSGDYAVEVSNPFGSLTSAPVQLTVLSAPLIVGQPQDLLVTNGQSAVFTVTASGAEPLSYQWYFNLTNSLPGETNTALVLTNATPNNAGVYHVAVSNPGSIALSDAARLTVIVPPNMPPTVRWLSPTDGVVYFVIDPIHLVVDASDADGAVARVEFFDGPSLIGEATFRPGEGYVFEWVGAAAGEHDLVALATDDEGATNRSNPIRITVNPLPTPQILLVSTGAVWKYLDTGQDPGVLWRTNDFDDGAWLSGPAELGYGDDVEGRPEATVLSFGLDPNNKYPTYYFRSTFQVTNASTISELTLRVQRDDGVVVYLNGTELFRDNLPEGDVQSTNLAVSPIEKEAETVFIVTNLPPDQLVEGTNLLAVEIHQAAADSPDISFDLELIGTQPGAPIILSQPQDQVVIQGQTARFRVVAASAQTSSTTGPLAYRWYRDGLSPVLVATNATLIITNAQTENEGSYFVQVSNPIASVRSDEVLLRVLVPPQIIAQPESVSAVRGDTVQFSVMAAGSPPLRYEWHVNNGAALDGAITNTLVLSDVRQSNAGAYQVVVANDVGSVTSQVAMLTLIGGPTILAQPRNATVLTGATVQFDVAAQGIGPLTYQWHFNATNVLPGATNSSLVLSNVTLPLSGQYHVLVSDDAGVTPSQPALLRVLAQPGISHLSQTGSVARLVFSTEIGLRYTVEYTDKLSAAGWLLLPDAVKLTGTGNELQILDSTATGPERFYRVRVE